MEKKCSSSVFIDYEFRRQVCKLGSGNRSYCAKDWFLPKIGFWIFKYYLGILEGERDKE